MIEFIAGVVVDKSPTYVVIENNGIGYMLHVSLETSNNLPAVGAPARLKTYLHVREDSMQLYAFASEQERKVFLGLISVSGIGPRLAQTILSGLKLSELITAIQEASVQRLTAVSGIGKKTAQRLIIELKEKFAEQGLIQKSDRDPDVPEEFTSLEEEAMLALLSLGYKKQAIAKALAGVRRRNGNVETVEELIKEVLHII